ncbi:hypothetical protein M0812_09778 [Anaeramoeba flamelloides]|uniref:HSF-type DNA-binding domain-containing protein n=1 Tax=Anaeramoeba flamelloides TaxID=1746091 RepID=A0AAV7ZRK8_9EUKA|nr:hypothetical protein M0812_09778 [Anaeramoeba flamelloides]
MEQQKEKILDQLSTETGLNRDESKIFLSVAKGDYMTAVGLHVLCVLQNIKHFNQTTSTFYDMETNCSNLKIESYGKNQQQFYKQSPINNSTEDSKEMIEDLFSKKKKLQTNKLKIQDLQTIKLSRNRKRKPLKLISNPIKAKIKNEDKAVELKKTDSGMNTDSSKNNGEKNKKTGGNKRRRSSSDYKKVKKQLNKILKSKKITFKQLKMIMTTDPIPRWKDRFSIFKYYDPTLITNWPEGLEKENTPIIIDKRFFTIYHSFSPNILAKNLQRGMTYFFESYGFKNCSKFHRKKMVFKRSKDCIKKNK